MNMKLFMRLTINNQMLNNQYYNKIKIKNITQVEKIF